MSALLGRVDQVFPLPWESNIVNDWNASQIVQD